MTCSSRCVRLLSALPALTLLTAMLLTAMLLTSTAWGADIDTLVVCPAVFRPALKPWIDYRTAQGHKIGLLSNDASAEQIREAIRREAAGGKLKAVLLVGDAEPGMAHDPQLRARCVPVHREPSRVVFHYGGERTIASDNYYADVNGDGLPDLAIGRLTPDTPEQLSAMVRRIIAYEQSTDFGIWRRQINLVAASGGFGDTLDGILETGVRYFLATGVPESYRTTMTYASWSSPFCPDPQRFGATALERLNEGCLFWVYAGHGQIRDLDRCNVPGHHYPILRAADVGQLGCQRGAPVALLFCCYAGAFDAREPCLAEELLRRDGGPVAVLAGSRVTMPYGMAVLGSELLAECLDRHRATLGEVVLHAKRNMAGDGRDNPQRQWLDRLAALVSPTRDALAEERIDHIHLFNLLGDPLLTLHYPRKIKLTAPNSAAAGGPVEIVCRSSVAGHCTLELAVRRDRFTFTPAPREKYDDSDAARESFQKVYAKANDSQLARVEMDVPAGEFHATLSLPAEARGPCCVRAYIAGAHDYAQGWSELNVSSAEQPSERETTVPRARR